MSDFRTLIDRARAGEPEAIEQLFQQHLDGLRAFVRLRSGEGLRFAESQSDLVQTVCREVLGSLQDAQCQDEAAFRSWLYSVAHHKILGKADYHRAQKRDIGRQVDAGEDGGLLEVYGNLCSPSQVASQREQVAKVEAAFDQLSEDHRRVILEVCLLGRAHRAVAEEMERSEEALRQLLTRARARLAMLMRQQGQD